MVSWRKQKNRKKRGIKEKMTIAFVSMGVLLSFGVGIGVFLISYGQVSDQYSDRAFNSAKAAVVVVNGDSIMDYLKNGKDDKYLTTYNALKDLKIAFDLEYLYIVTENPLETGTAVYVFDIFTEGNDPSLVGDLGEKLHDSDAAAFDAASQTFRTGWIEDNTLISITTYGWLATAYVPIFASDGSITAVMGVDISMNRIVGEIILRSLQVLLITVAVIVVVLLILRYITGKLMLDPIMRLSFHMDGFDPENDESDKIEFRESGDEFQTISENYNQMVGDIRYYMENLAAVTADRERIATELNIATDIQTSMLPYVFPAFPERNEFDIYAAMYPAREVGGDFYDFFLIDNNTLAVVIADVSDKGIPAALFMVITKTLIKNAALDGKSPKEVFETVNDMLSENNETGMSVTAFMGYLDIPTGRLTYVNAGHRPPLIKQENIYKIMDVDLGNSLAIMGGKEFLQEESMLNTDDMLYLYTDGIMDVMDKAGNPLTEKHLLEMVNRHSSSPLNKLILNLKEEIDIFSDGAEQSDDITMLVLEIKAQKEKPEGCNMFKLVVPANVDRLDEVMEFTETAINNLEMDKKRSINLNIAVEEIFVNIANYAYQSGEGDVTILLSISDDNITVEFKDTGVPYDPLDKSDPDTTLSADEREIGGLGIFMVKQMMDSISYRYEDNHNILTITQNRQ